MPADQVSPETMSKFCGIKEALKQFPAYDVDMYQKIQAFDWLISATQLLSSQNKVNQGKELKEGLKDL